MGETLTVLQTFDELRSVLRTVDSTMTDDGIHGAMMSCPICKRPISVSCGKVGNVSYLCSSCSQSDIVAALAAKIHPYQPDRINDTWETDTRVITQVQESQENVEKLSYIGEQSVPIQLHALADVVDEPVNFLCDPYIPLGRLTMLQADSGTGKTYLMCAIAAMVTGAAIPAESGIALNQQGAVLLLSAEDDQSALKQRIKYAGGDLHKVLMPTEADMLRLGLTGDAIYELIRTAKPLLVILDPLQLFMTGIDMNRANETRPLLARLADIAKQVGCAIVIIAHFGKAKNRAIYASVGSIDIPAAMRSIISLYRDPERNSTLLHAIHTKSSNAAKGKTIQFELVSVPEDTHVAKVRWLGTRQYTEDDYEFDLRLAERMTKSESEYSDNPLVEVIRKLAAENERDLYLDHDSFAEAYMILSGHVMRMTSAKVTRSINSIAQLLEQQDNIRVSVTNGKHRTSEHFIADGNEHKCYKAEARCICISKIQ